MVAVEARQGTLAARGKGLPPQRRGRQEGRKEGRTDIKSNNPHLTGEEKKVLL